MSKLAKALTAAAGNAGAGALYVEDVFSTYLYEGSGAARTIDNNIALSDEGGLVWLKQRGALDSHVLFDTVNGPEASLSSNSTDASSNYSSYLSFPSAGTTGWNLSGAILNGTGTTWASWTFRKAEKFFDVVTYTGTGGGAGTGQTIAHSLDSTPACMIVKNRTTGSNWTVYHKDSNATPEDYKLELNGTGAASFNANSWNRTAPTSTHFTVGNNDNASGDEYVAYLFASDAGGFGDDGSESIIKCGSFSTDASGIADVTLDWEPQYVLVKKTSSAQNWVICDTMRGWSTSTTADKYLAADTSSAESDQSTGRPTATGFYIDAGSNFGASSDYIYIAIRRPMKTPESGTEVFSVSDSMSGAVQPAFDAPHVVDMAFQRRPAFTQTTHIASRLTGTNNLYTDTTSAEVSQVENVWDFMGGWGGWSVTNTDYRAWNFKRATGFFDVVAYSGDSVAGRTVAHNLRVVPELMIVKRRSASQSWYVYNPNKRLQILNTDVAEYSESITAAYFGDGSNVIEPTSTQFTLSDSANVNTIGQTYISYHFATLAGVSKVGSYTGTGSNVDVDCGFSAGARFILIKRTDSTGDWYVWDSERGIVAGNDPYLLLNSTAAEVTNTDYIDPLNAGFTVTSSAPAALNASGGTYIFLAIA